MRNEPLGLLAILSILFVAGCSESVSGTVTVGGNNPSFGDWSTPVTDCAKGGGITLTGADGRSFAVDQDPVEGPSIEVPMVGGGAATLFENSCRVLQVSISYSGETENYDDLMDGSFSADCDLPGGGTIVGSATFSDCG
jgi:hypothetical protein